MEDDRPDELFSYTRSVGGISYALARQGTATGPSSCASTTSIIAPLDVCKGVFEVVYESLKALPLSRTTSRQRRRW